MMNTIGQFNRVENQYLFKTTGFIQSYVFDVFFLRTGSRKRSSPINTGDVNTGDVLYQVQSERTREIGSIQSHTTSPRMVRR